MLVFDHPGIRNLTLRIIHHRITLVIVAAHKCLCLKLKGSVFQVTQTEIKVLIHHACINHLIIGISCMICHTDMSVLLLLRCKLLIGDTCLYLDSTQHILYHYGIAANRNPLIPVIEIIIIIGEAKRQSLDDKGWKFFAVPAPLLLCIPLHQLLIDILTNQGKGLLFQIGRLRDPQTGNLFRNLFPCLGRRYHTPHFVKGVHVKRQII